MTEIVHINPAFDIALQKMDGLLVQMEKTLQDQLILSHQAFTEMSVKLSKQVRENDVELNKLQRQVDESIIDIFARYHPVAEDLRHVIGALKMSIEYERVGDYIKNLAKSVSRMAAYDDHLEIAPVLVTMLEVVTKHFNKFCEYRLQGDMDKAQKLWIKDQNIDDLCHDAVKKAFAFQKSGSGNEHSLIHAVSVAKNLERIGDKIKNLIEILYNIKTGEDLDIDIDL